MGKGFLAEESRRPITPPQIPEEAEPEGREESSIVNPFEDGKIPTLREILELSIIGIGLAKGMVKHSISGISLNGIRALIKTMKVEKLKFSGGGIHMEQGGVFIEMSKIIVDDTGMQVIMKTRVKGDEFKVIPFHLEAFDLGPAFATVLPNMWVSDAEEYLSSYAFVNTFTDLLAVITGTTIPIMALELSLDLMFGITESEIREQFRESIDEWTDQIKQSYEDSVREALSKADLPDSMSDQALEELVTIGNEYIDGISDAVKDVEESMPYTSFFDPRKVKLTSKPWYVQNDGMNMPITVPQVGEGDEEYLGSIGLSIRDLWWNFWNGVSEEIFGLPEESDSSVDSVPAESIEYYTRERGPSRRPYERVL
jgi:hypothetical protein